MKLSVGDIVTSIQGRDIGTKYVVWSIEGNTLFLVNGKQRKIVNPKKKKTIHVAFYNKSEILIQNLKLNKKINDAYLRKVLNNSLVKGDYYG